MFKKSPNPRMQRTPSAPLMRTPLGATLAKSRRVLVLSWVAWWVACLLPADIAPTPIPSLEERVSHCELVGLAQIEAGETAPYTDQLYRARIKIAIKGTTKDAVIFFAGAPVGSEAYGLGETYLLFLRPSGKRLGEARNSWPRRPESAFPADAVLYDAVCPYAPLPLRYRRSLDSEAPVFLVPGGCFTLPPELGAQSVGSRADPFLVWVSRDRLLTFISELADREARKKDAGA